MKRIFVSIWALMLTLVFCIGVSAEVTVTDGEVSPEESYAESEDVLADADASETVLTRIYEYYDDYKTEIKGLFDLIVYGLFVILGKGFANKIKSFKKETNDQIAASSQASNDKTNELIDAYNKTAEAMVVLTTKVDELIHKVEEVDKNTLDTEEIEINIARMLNAAFSRLKLPNGTKDVVNAEFAQIIDKGHASTVQENAGDEDEE